MTGAALCKTWLHFSAARVVLWTDVMETLQNELVGGCQLCAQLSIFEGSLAASFLMLSTSKIEAASLFWSCEKTSFLFVSQTCFAFSCCQLQKLRQSG